MESLDSSAVDEFLSSNRLTVILAITEWCYPCKLLINQLDNIELNLELNVACIDVDDNFDFANKYNVIAVPATLLFKEKRMIGKLYGGKTDMYLSDFLLSELTR